MIRAEAAASHRTSFAQEALPSPTATRSSSTRRDEPDEPVLPPPIQLDEAAANSCDEMILPGTEARLISPSALARWDGITLLEDDSARALRLGAPGVLEAARHVLVRAHRIDDHGIRVAATRTYVPGLAPDGEAKRRSDLALELLDEVSCTGSVVVCGATYGASSRFVNSLAERGLDAVVEVRPSSTVASLRGAETAEAIRASELIGRAHWQRFSVPVAGIEERTVAYAVARLGMFRLGSGPSGLLFAAQTGEIDGVHRGTMFGFSLVRDPSLAELIETVGWARWIRPLVRRAEKTAESHFQLGGEAVALKNGRPLRLRANIKLSRKHDQADALSRQAPADGAQPKADVAGITRTINVVELFAGAGGMGLGFLLANARQPRYRLVYAGEVDPVYVQTLRSNHARMAQITPGIANLIPAQAEPVDLRSERALDEAISHAAGCGGADVVIGGPPCQGFSNANRNSWHSANPHNQLIDIFLRYVERLAPRIFLLENVQGIHWTRKNGAPSSRSNVLEHIRERMAAAGYDVFVQLLDAVWYGVPQYRSRFFVMGLHRDLGHSADQFGTWGPFPLPSHGPGTSHPYVTVRDAIGELPPLPNGHETDEMKYGQAEPSANAFLSFVRAGAEPGTITDHVTSRHAEYVIERYRMIPPGGNWESIADLLTNYADVKRTHSNIYRRLLWGEPSITIGHYRKSMLVHPSQHRGLSLREAARLQSFPDWFRFAGTAAGEPGGLVHKQQQLANAVCPLVAKAIAEFILQL